MVEAQLQFHDHRLALDQSDARSTSMQMVVKASKTISVNNRLMRNVFLRKIEAERVAEIERVENLRAAKLRHQVRSRSLCFCAI